MIYLCSQLGGGGAVTIVSDCQDEAMNSLNNLASWLGSVGNGLFRTLSAACYCAHDVMSCLGFEPNLVPSTES